MDDQTYWCLVDACPSFICQGPHREVLTTLGIEVLHWDQEPIGTPVKGGDDGTTEATGVQIRKPELTDDREVGQGDPDDAPEGSTWGEATPEPTRSVQGEEGGTP